MTDIVNQMIIASRVGDGLVVFRDADGAWVESIDSGAIAPNAGDANRWLDRSLQDERDNLVIDPYLIEVTRANGQVKPTVYREYIRALGPTVQPEQ